MTRVRVIPGHCLSLYPEPPSPPESPPPRPGRLCKIAMVGDARSGKTSLVQKIIHRRYSPHGDGEGCDGCGGANGTNNGDGAASRGPSDASVDSAGSPVTAATSGVTSYDGLEPTLAEYHKKDVTIWNGRVDADWSRENARRERDGEEALQERLVCVRVQLWDMNVHKRFVDRGDKPDSNSVRSGESSFHSPRPAPDIAPLLPLLRRIHGVMIACRCPLPPSPTSQSPNVSLASNGTNNSSGSGWPELHSVEVQLRRWTTSPGAVVEAGPRGVTIACRCPPPPSSSSPQSPDASLTSNGSNNYLSGKEWPELHSVEQQIRRWTTFLSEQSNDAKQRPIVFVTLSCADLVVARYSPREWVRLDDEMREICGKYGIDSWDMITCTNSRDGGDDDSPQDRRSNKQPTLLRRMQERQRHMLEDMEDAAEAALIDMISMLLD